MFDPVQDCKPSKNVEPSNPLFRSLRRFLGQPNVVPAGKYYGLCPCSDEKCPEGYDYTVSNFSNIQFAPDKKCGEIAGVVPTSNKWNQDDFDKCVTQYNNKNNKSFKSSMPANTEQDKIIYNSMYDNNNGIQKRITSFNKSLGERVNKDFSFLKGQIDSTDKMQNVNNRWNSIIDDMNEMDRQVTNEIQVKTRLTEINDDDARQKNSKIMTILGAFSALFIFIGAGVGFFSGNISLSTMFIYLCVGVLVFFILAVSLNKYTVKEFKKISNILEKEILNKGDDINIKALQWVDDNCKCPKNTYNNLDQFQKKNTYNNLDQFQKKNTYNKKMEHHKYDNGSIYYDDGTLKHKITPSDFAREIGVLPEDIIDKNSNSK
jgi:hypothetical protein